MVIVTGDRDMWQLVNEQVRVHIPGGGKRESRLIDRQACFDGLGVWPEQVPDYKGLAGDESDNIPGVVGIGPKTARQLLAKYASLEGVYNHIEQIEGSVHDKLIRDKEVAFLSKELATIKTDVSLQFDWHACKVAAYDKEKAIATLMKYNFKSLVPALPIDEFEEEVQEALF